MSRPRTMRRVATSVTVWAALAFSAVTSAAASANANEAGGVTGGMPDGVTQAAASDSARGTTGDEAAPSPHASLGLGKVDTSQQLAPASGFWTSRAPAKGGAYRYPLLIIGVIVAMCTAGMLIIGLRRVGRANQQQ